MAGSVKNNVPATQGSGYERAALLFQYFQGELLSGHPPCGNVFYVSSTTTGASDTAGFGYSPAAPMATMAYALGSTGPLTSNNDDALVVLPNHTEAVVAAGTITSAKTGIRVFGLGQGLARPLITYTTVAGASVNITGAQQRWSNIVFNPVGVAAVTAAVNVSVADVSFFKCTWINASATNQAALGLLTTSGADRLSIDSCEAWGTANAGTAAAFRIVGGNDIRITNSFIHGNFTTTLGGIDNATTNGLRWLIQGNTIINQTASSTVAINCQATTTGFINNNRLGILMGTAPIVAAGAYWGGNYYAASVGSVGVLG